MTVDRVRLPVDDALPRLHDALRHPSVVIIEAPAGTGKTTRVPPSLLDQPWIGNDRVVVLEPRRVAARAAARRMASERGERIGDTIGLRTRNDTRVGPSTRLEVVTEGVLTRMLLNDPALEGIGVVVFDEFHERSLHADTALAFVRETRAALRPDLRLILMSATFDADALAARLQADSVVRVEAVTYPVAITYRAPDPGQDLTDAMTKTIVSVLGDDAHRGDLLAFLPGAAAINRVDRTLRNRLGSRVGTELTITPLHGSLTATEQDQALRPDPDDRRKVILSTPIAETSVTIDGVATVIDSGLRRRPVIDHGRGMSRLQTVSASLASAEQRAGRAGRQQPGSCVRLWAMADDRHRLGTEPAEIERADLTALALDLAAWGATDPGELWWLDTPPQVAFDQARNTLASFGAIDNQHRLTDHGRAMHRLGAEPRLAHVMITSTRLEATHPGAVATSAALAAALADRDLLRGRDRPVDLRRRLDLIGGGNRATQVDRAALEQATSNARRWRNDLAALSPGAADQIDSELTGLLISVAFPDRIARRRADAGSFLLASGAGVSISPDDALAHADWLAVAETDGVGAEARVLTAAPLHLTEIEAHHADAIDEVDHGGWDRRARDVVFERRTQLGALVLHRRPMASPPSEVAIEALLTGVRREGLQLLRWDEADHRWRDRLAFAGSIQPDAWPAVDDASLLGTLEAWLAPHLRPSFRRSDLRTLSARVGIDSLLDWQQRTDLDRLVPTHIEVPSGSRIPIDYGAERGPVLAVRLQELFGLTTTPTVYNGRVPLVVHLLSPANRPVQVTLDLASFWAEGYVEVRKELRGRYPRHHWPEDPLTAPPTNRARQRRSQRE